MKFLYFGILFFVASQISLAQPTLSYYYNQELKFDPSIPSPKEILGFEVGEWHVSHDKLVHYMKALASASDRVTLEVTGYTYEQRPLLLLTITSPSNHSNLPTIKKSHLSINSTTKPTSTMPVVVWLGHSIHGNEASGSNAALLVAYYLAAAQGPIIDSILANTITLLDPSYNPDGLNRFASWVNSHKSKNLDPDSNSLEHNEAWPFGRTNHYWFDLNRDWLPIQHPETEARIKKFYEWHPNILTDQHEMNTNATYFFQPGISSRNNPITPKKNIELTKKIAVYHAQAMDKIGSLYYSEESFDDFYPGKGSTFPDITGSVGILFEQASSRGHLQESVNGNLSFPFTIRNHVTTSLSTLKAAQKLKPELLAYQHDFFKKVSSLSSKDPIKAYIFSGGDDYNKSSAFMEVLNKHHIEVNKLGKNYANFLSKNSYIVTLNQPQYRLIKTIFEKRTSFEDSLFYDVSAWTLPLAFGIEYKELTLKQLNEIELGKQSKKIAFSPTKLAHATYGYLLPWDDYLAPAALNLMQQSGLRVKLATTAFQFDGITYREGTCFIPSKNQPISTSKIFDLITKASSKYNVQFISINSGNATGVKMGSPSLVMLDPLNIAVVAGKGISSYEVGEVWHLLDQRMNIPMSLISINQLNSNDLSKYNTIIMVNGTYDKLEANLIKNWVHKGGLIIATKSAGKWLSSNKISMVSYLSTKADSTEQRPYGMMDRYNGAQVIGGGIFETAADISHPLFYGYHSSFIPVFRNSTIMMKRNKSAYVNPLMYKSNPLLSGYISSRNLSRLSNTAAVQVDKVGKGNIITFTDNPNFRAFWYGTNRMFLNALFFGKSVKAK